MTRSSPAARLNLAGTTTSVTPVFSGTPDTVNPYTIITYGGSLTGHGTICQRPRGLALLA